MSHTLFRFRRDLRREDNTGLRHALQSANTVLPVFIFDTSITGSLPADDHRITLIYDTLQQLHQTAREHGSSLIIRQGVPQDIIPQLIDEYAIDTVITNHDYEPSATRRDEQIRTICHDRGVTFETYQDQVIFEKDDLLSGKGTPYTVYTPYKKKRLATLTPDRLRSVDSESYLDRLTRLDEAFPSMESLGFVRSSRVVRPHTFEHIDRYGDLRDDPAGDYTSYMGPYLRFGLASIRRLARWAQTQDEVYLSELIWREFFMQVMWHFPHTVEHPFRPEYEDLPRRESDEDFVAWQEGRTGYPIVDAGMRQLAQTGYMHNRVRMIVASFLCKHLLIHRKRGERHFAQHLFDYELASNIGNRQRAASTGVDAVPYFRIFNPRTQQSKFDPDYDYIRRRIPDFDPETYIDPIVDHKFARERAIRVFREIKEKAKTQ